MFKVMIRDFQLIFFWVSVVLISGCYPPVDNYLVQSSHNAVSWVGVTVAELIFVKGNPSRIQYEGWSEKTSVTSEYWAPSLDRYLPLYRTYQFSGTSVWHKPASRAVYAQLNSQGPWLFVYRKPVRNYRAQFRYCTEYYLIGKNGKILRAGFSTANRRDHRHCPIPLSYPRQS